MQLHTTSGRWRLGLALSLMTVFLWGVLPVALSVTLQKLDVYTVIWFRFFVSFWVLGAYLAARKQLPSPAKLRLIPLSLLGVAVVGLALNYVFFMLGLSLTTPGNAQVLIQLAAVLMGLGGLVIFKERYTLRQWLGLSVLSLGFVLFFNEQLRSLVTAQGKYLLGSGALVLGSLTWAFYALAQKQLLQKLPSASVMLIIYGSCAFLFMPFATPARLFLLSPLQWGMLIFAALNTVCAYGAFAEALEHWEASRVSAVLALTPIVTLISVSLVAFWVPGLLPVERITILAVLGAVFVVAGSMTIALGKSR
ncbi:DMT family transporter [Ancylothrix sp. C2]|uniref:DMT family transporter n=1 Tax=Ancylothrix sp. D3o TaxID=2953691 RepID=UPI0021BB73E0|nr:DMT family transporter [Ancylothrix sp. D3o]MCT7950566.1 DMT family transporter [Ancylothrix sp. D3o]